VTDSKRDLKDQEAVTSQVLSILPLKGTVVFPYLVVPLMIQQVEQTRLVDDALMRGARIGLFMQRDPQVENPGPDDLYTVGTSGNILKMLRFPDGSVRFLIQGLSRIRVTKFVTETPYLSAEVEDLHEEVNESVELEALQRNLMEAITNLGELAPYLGEEFHISAINQDTPSKLVDFVASSLNVPAEHKQEVLQDLDVQHRMGNLYKVLNKEIEVLELSQEIQAKAASELGKSQRDYILREQLKAIKKELGHGEDGTEIEEFERKIEAAIMPAHAERIWRRHRRSTPSPGPISTG